MKVSVVRPAELGEPELAAWRAMQRATPALGNPYLAPEFTLGMGRLHDNVRVAVLTDGSRPAGFLPFERYAAGVGKAVGADMAMSGCQGLVHAPGLRWEPRALLRACGLAVWEFNHLIAEQRPFRPYQVIRRAAPVVDLSDGFDFYFAGLRRTGGKRVSEARRKERKLSRETGQVRFELDTYDEAALRTLLAWKSEQYRRTGRSNPFDKEWVPRLVDDLSRRRGDGFAGVVSMLYAGDEPIAGIISLRFDRTLSGWFTAYDPRYAKYSPGTMQFLRLAEAAAAAGIQYIDLGPGDKAYKEMFKSTDRWVTEGWALRASPAAAVHVARRAPFVLARETVLRNPRLLASADRTLKRYGRLRTRARR